MTENLQSHALIEHAERELQIIGSSQADDGYRKLMELLTLFIMQQHPPEATAMIGSMFAQLVQGEVLSPLTGEDSEWRQINPHLWQNVRSSRVFKATGEGAFDARGVIFVDDDDNMFVKNPQSRVAIKFPYQPQSKFIRLSRKPQLIVPSHVRN